ncbi:MAG: hypothetical protein IJN91_01750, partial [Alphaproteobacteria bacterium]|nr:hypothetical protein [Alphaproteobacteria bacterium]
IGCFAVFCAHAAQVVNVDYVHKLIAQKWDISVPIKTNNIMAVANMKYLLTAVDVANEILNGEKTTDYGNTEFATLQVADTVATIQAVDTLIQKPIEYKFFLTTTRTNSFSFSISAAGKFYIDWGDGKTETITKPDTTDTKYTHNYDTAGAYTIGIGGQATAYNTDTSTAAISFIDTVDWEFESTWKIASIDGSLGAIFGTLADGSQPRFYETFYDAYNMVGSIPENLFAGISGAPTSYMFAYTFYFCSGLTSIPAGLFAGLSGAPAKGMFSGTFSNCSGLTGSIPAGLFAGISGAPAENMFDRTFSDCSGLTGAIPAGLFGNLTSAPARAMFSGTFAGCSGLTGAIPDGLFGDLTGAPAITMFYNTFNGCSGLTSIPENLFGNISGTAQSYMFYQTFYNCTSLTGPSARINGQYLYEIWPDAISDQVGEMYYNATGLSDYSSIPSAWK